MVATPYWDNGMTRLYHANARSLPIPDNSVDCVCTSPPYWGLRDYGLGEWEGGNSDCDHIRVQGDISKSTAGYNANTNHAQEPWPNKTCGKCGAIRVDDGIGLEPTPDAYCANMVEVFREVWRVLKPTGTLWLNLGDSYAGSTTHGTRQMPNGLKSKDLVGIPWRVAFALQADGWYLRSDIIWSKPNPMPESVTDRPTKAHEYVFLLTKSPRYYYDADAISEKGTSAIGSIAGYAGYTARAKAMGREPSGNEANGIVAFNSGNRNKRSVWEITTKGYPEAHFATYPEKLVEPCILAGSSEKGVCAQCGKPWERIVEHAIVYDHVTTQRGKFKDGPYASQTGNGIGTHDIRHGVYSQRTYKGWQPTCDCNADVVPATVLDPFAGSGTTLAVAQRLGRRSVGADLSAEYLALAKTRLEAVSFPLPI